MNNTAMYEYYYRKYLNDFLTMSMFASWLGVDPRKARKYVRKGSALSYSRYGYIIE